MLSSPPLQRNPARPADPWGYPVDPYERDHDRVILDSLRRGSYDCGYEAGCGAGELTVQLAPCCDRLIASDIVPTAIARARKRLSHLHHVSVRCSDVAEFVPDAPLDLIVLREVGYSMQPAEMLRVSLALSERLAAGGELVVLHGRLRKRHCAMTTESIHGLLAANLPLEWSKHEPGVSYRLDCWTKL